MDSIRRLWNWLAPEARHEGRRRSYHRLILLGVEFLLRTALIGLVLAVPFLLTGSLLPSILAHAAFDLIVGLWLADWLLRR